MAVRLAAVVLPEPTHVVELPDGRALAADVVGSAGGQALVYLHGSPDCRLARHPDDGLAASLGVRLVAVDRPGWGWTSPGATVRSWSDDVGALLDSLGVDRFAVAAWSAGAPWAYGLAASFGERVTAVTTYGAVAPFEALADPEVAAASGPRVGIVEEVAAGMTIDDLVDGVASMLLPPVPVDLALARDVVVEGYSPAARAEVDSVPGMVDRLALSLAAAIDRHGAAGLHADLAVQYAPGLPDVLAEVAAPVRAIHGEHDPIAGPACGGWLVDHVPNGTTDVWGRGHQGLLADWPRFLTEATATP